MPKSSNCDAEICIVKAANRTPRIRCEFCTISVHTKCAKLDNTVAKVLRDSAGIRWLCPNCRDPDKRSATSNNNTIELILQRSTSTLKLVGALMETVQILSRLIRTLCSRPVCSAVRPSVLDMETSTDHNDPLNFTEIFESIMNGDKRPRSSSFSRPSLAQPEKITRVDVSVDQTSASNSIVPSVSDADVRITAEQRCADLLHRAASEAALEAATLAAELAATAHNAGDSSALATVDTREPSSHPAATQHDARPTAAPQLPATSTASLITAAPHLPSNLLSAAPTMSPAVMPPMQVSQPLLIMPQALPPSLTMPSLQPLVTPHTTTLSSQPLVTATPPPPPKTTPSLQPLVLPPPLIMAPPLPLITQPLQTASQASTSAALHRSPTNTNFEYRINPVNRLEEVVNENQQQTQPIINYEPNPTSFTVTNGGRITIYGPSPHREHNQFSSVITSLSNTIRNDQFQPQNSTPLTTQVTNLCETTYTDRNIPLPTLLVAPPEPTSFDSADLKWFYVSRFLPNETPDNLIRYVHDKTNCYPTSILCQKLVRQNRSSTRPLTFLSFKLSVPQSIENLVVTNGLKV